MMFEAYPNTCWQSFHKLPCTSRALYLVLWCIHSLSAWGHQTRPCPSWRSQFQTMPQKVCALRERDHPSPLHCTYVAYVSQKLSPSQSLPHHYCLGSCQLFIRHKVTVNFVIRIHINCQEPLFCKNWQIDGLTLKMSHLQVCSKLFH